jgi:hypothetical protein
MRTLALLKTSLRSGVVRAMGCGQIRGRAGTTRAGTSNHHPDQPQCGAKDGGYFVCSLQSVPSMPHMEWPLGREATL